GDINTNDAAIFLIDDRINGNRGFTSLAIADDQLALSSSDRDHCIDCFDSSLQRFAHRRAINNSGSNSFYSRKLLRNNRAFSIEWFPNRIDDASDQSVSNRDGHNFARALYLVATFNCRKVAKQNCANAIFVQVKRDADNIMRKINELTIHNF